MDEVKKFCVIGLPVSHSLSPMIHKEFAKQQGINIQYKMIAVSYTHLTLPTN